MKFKNIVTGNVLTTNNAKTVALMRDSDRYVEVTDKPTQQKSNKLSSKLTTAELEKIALEEGVNLDGCTTNEQKRAAIELARENKAN